ncbi:MAG: hypothetical protein Q8918_03865 [Bacteroidota bacterium]|nr:hypothetical protein [Bacteroidota bacterium]
MRSHKNRHMINQAYLNLRHLQSGLLLFCFLVQFTMPAGAQVNYLVTSKDVTIRLSGEGKIISIRFGKTGMEKKLVAFSSIEGCSQQGKTVVRRGENGSLTFSRTLMSNSAGDSNKRYCVVMEKFIPTASSIRWELEIEGQGKPWSSRINTQFDYPATPQTRFWAAWGAPPYSPSSVGKALAETLRPFPGGSDAVDFVGRENNQWIDPLHAIPFADTTMYYGLPYFTYQQPRVGICPFQGNLFCIPMCSILEKGEDAGLTFVLSPEDDIIDLVMNTRQKGSVIFSRLFNRISSDHHLEFSLDIVPQAADWREGLGWISSRYPRYFQPQNKQAYQLAGTGAYAGPFAVSDDARLREMDFKTNWQSSFDFPYMGMFLPPIGKGERWKRFGDSTISADQMDDYAAKMKKAGFHVLNYFNVTEFGTKVQYPAPVAAMTPEADWWKDCNSFLYRKLPGAILKVPAKMRVDEGGKTQPGGPIYTWEDGIAMDCGDLSYKNFLVSQALRHIQEIPDADGICIDRLDWLRFFNEQADDDETWFDGKPVRSLIHSFKQLMDTLGPLMHRAGKNIFVNNHDKRIDILNHTDGIFDEFTYAGAPLNLTAFLSLSRPALGWTDAAATVKKEGADNFFQKYLYMGVFPMCPYPANDHSIRPDSAVDNYYVEYAPLLRLLQGRTWVLKPHVVSVENNLAKVNIFETPEGYVIPVVYGKADRIRVVVDEAKMSLNGRAPGVYEAWYPGVQNARVLSPERKGNRIYLEIPMIRGCAMINVIR